MATDLDVAVNVAKLRPQASSDGIKQFNEMLMEVDRKHPKWFEVGAARYREMKERGDTPFPAQTVLERGKALMIPSRDPDRYIPCRVMVPEDGKQVKAVFMHIHGGGWVIGSEDGQDPLISAIADGSDVAVVSVGYRLAPEHPFPQGPNDCFDVADWLVDRAEERFGATFQFIGGESAGGHLTLLSYLHLVSTRPRFRLSGLIFDCGVFNLDFLPSVLLFKKPWRLILDEETMDHYRNAVCPGMPLEQVRDPSISPFYADFKGMALPPAIFNCGTEDCLLDDTVMMSARWQMSGGETEVHLVAGAPHAYMLFPLASVAESRQHVERVCSFVSKRIQVAGITMDI